MKASAVLLLCAAAVLAQGADAAAGGKIFAEKCAICHSIADHETKIGPPLKDTSKGKLPSGRNATREVLLKQINDGGAGMPVFRELLTSEEKENVIAYVMTL